MKPGLKVGITILILITLVFVFYYSSRAISNVTGKSILGWIIKEDTGKYDSFAQCLTKKGAKMYGSKSCNYCSKQKAMFADSFQYVDYVECAEQQELCQGLTGVPAWEIKGKLYYGVQELDELSELTGCSIN